MDDGVIHREQKHERKRRLAGGMPMSSNGAHGE